MTINNIFSVLSSSELVLEFKVLKAVVEPPVQALKATVTLKGGYILQIMKVQGQILDDIPTTCKKETK
jgi:hypothetical protein